ncbi:MAG: exodeoxyribonuclease VII large subunit [Chloroflexota bacterium]
METLRAPDQKVFRVSQLTHYVRYLIERDELLSAMSVRGEVANLTRSPAGHVYFDLKDDSSKVSCVLFRREVARQPEEAGELRAGIEAEVHGHLTIYEPRGAFQIYVQRIRAFGAGAAARQLEQLRTRLQAEGLFATERKRALPEYPSAIALVTSPGSQAYHDVLRRLGDQYPFVRVIEVPVTVQGDSAADEMAMAIEMANRLTRADVILLVRGGGAPEELAAFNEERLVRSVFASRIPVVTGVGHEMDHTLVDFVADVRAATPSLAAAASVPDVRSLVQRTILLHGQALQAMRDVLRTRRDRFEAANRALVRAAPQTRLKLNRQRNDELVGASRRLVALRIREDQNRLLALRSRLEAYNPLSTLGRGYAVLTDEQGRVVSRVEQAIVGDPLTARVSDGSFSVRVRKK